jgi:hypothetical protein
MSCIYPNSNNTATSSSRLLLPHALETSVPAMEDTPLARVTADDLIIDPAFAPAFMDSDVMAPLSLMQPPKVPANRKDWFLEPETWKISHDVDSAVGGSVDRATMKKYIVTLQSWFERWIVTGSTPFIHDRLYKANFPACVQVAYATLTSYVYRTPATTDAVLQIVEDRSDDLLRENRVEEEEDMDVFAQLSRLHALMVYQIIGLHDGDIRSRHVAEGNIAVQNRWARKLLDSACKTLSNTDAAATQLVGCMPLLYTSTQQQWYLWILSESVRRTWLVATSMGSIFSALQQRWAECPGGIMFTKRSGLWDTASAADWERQCAQKNIVLLQRFECAREFNGLGSDIIDEFSIAMLEITLDSVRG